MQKEKDVSQVQLERTHTRKILHWFCPQNGAEFLTKLLLLNKFYSNVHFGTANIVHLIPAMLYTCIELIEKSCTELSIFTLAHYMNCNVGLM